ncbi:MAG TPA: TraB/GumN family protein [Methanobacteriaceae archaeon]|nr:TraB/GumN family protein [Methanobacteriaceae archaeon]
MAPEKLQIIGTAHVSQKSVEEVKNTILETEPDVVAVELCAVRYHNMMNENEGTEEKKTPPIREILKGNNLTLFLVSGFLSYMQKKIGDDVGVKPGAEMLAAIEAAQEVGAQLALIDRDIQITLQRALNQMSMWEKLKFFYGIIASFFSKDEQIEDLESIKEGDTLAEVMEYFQEMSPKAYHVLVDERDAYMAQMLLNQEGNVVAVVGAGHQSGIKHYMAEPQEIPPLYELNQIKKSRIPLGKLILYSIPVIFILIFVLAFLKGINIQMNIAEFILLTGDLSFAGSLLAGSKIASAIVAFLVAPVTALHPLLAAGWFAGIVEAKLRHVSLDDVSNISKCDTFRELWGNKLFRVLLVVVGANIGCTIGVFLSIPNVIYPLFSKLIGG